MTSFRLQQTLNAQIASNRLSGIASVVERRRHVDTSRGCFLTTQPALEKTREYHEKCTEAARREKKKAAHARVAKIPMHFLRAAARLPALCRKIVRGRKEARKLESEATTALANFSGDVDKANYGVRNSKHVFGFSSARNVEPSGCLRGVLQA